MRRLITSLVLLAACGDNIEPPADAAVTEDAPQQAVGPCLPSPTDLDRPPAGALPCDLLPPGFVAARTP